ncbi:MAG: flagellar hook-basal body complex protein FliE, partial [Verrucomicrobia bacterium 21-51-4]
VNHKQNVADKNTQDILLGQSDNLHSSIIAMRESSVAFGLLVEVRNSLMDSMHELTRMQVG